MKRIVINITIDDEAIAQSLRSNYLMLKRTFVPVVYVFILVLIRIISPSTHRAITKRTQPENGTYTAKNTVLTPQPQQAYQPKNNGVGESFKDLQMHSSTMVKCANPDCTQTFEYAKRGNQEKKFCSLACKDAVNNAKKMNTYYQYQ